MGPWRVGQGRSAGCSERQGSDGMSRAGLGSREAVKGAIMKNHPHYPGETAVTRKVFIRQERRAVAYL